VHVVERHEVQAAVGFPQGEQAARLVTAGDDLFVGDRDALGPSRAARGPHEQRDVRRARTPWPPASRLPRGVPRDVQERDLQAAGRLSRQRVPIRRSDQRSRTRLLQRSGELRRRGARIQRDAAGAAGHREQDHRGFGTAGGEQRDPIAALDARPVELVADGVDPAHEFAEADRVLPWSQDRSSLRLLVRPASQRAVEGSLLHQGPSSSFCRRPTSPGS
jgi:hypothetical protein